MADGILADEGVGVEEEDVFPVALPDGMVVGARKPKVVRTADEGDIRVGLGEDVNAAVAGMVVEDDDFGVYARQGFLHREEALPEIVLDVVADDDDG